MKWNSPGGRAAKLVIVAALAFVFVAILSAITAAFLGISFGLVFLHAVVAMPAPIFVYVSDAVVLGYVLIILFYEFQQGGNNDGELAGFAIGLGVVAAIMALFIYFRGTSSPSREVILQETENTTSPLLHRRNGQFSITQ